MRCFLGLSILFVGASVAHADLLNYHFNTDNEGWRRGDLKIATLTMTDVGAATWNAGGYIDAPDFANWSFHLSPVIAANMSSASRIEFDYSSMASDGPYPFVIFSSGVGAIYQTTTVPGDDQFHHYNYALTPGTWQFSDGVNFRVATASDIAFTLTNLQQFGINGDQQHGPEYTRLDNVVLVPEPVSALALSAGLIGLARRRRAK
ncbi:MAG: PEP-CTERM sorting domain-containing protein [Armatimonadota bacterium]